MKGMGWRWKFYFHQTTTPIRRHNWLLSYVVLIIDTVFVLAAVLVRGYWNIEYDNE